jgi:hypothetical protein
MWARKIVWRRFSPALERRAAACSLERCPPAPRMRRMTKGGVAAHLEELGVVVGFEGDSIKACEHAFGGGCWDTEVGEDSEANAFALSGVGDGVPAVVADGDPVNAEVDAIGVIVDGLAVAEGDPASHGEDADAIFGIAAAEGCGRSLRRCPGSCRAERRSGWRVRRSRRCGRRVRG